MRRFEELPSSETPWFPLFMIALCLTLFALALAQGNGAAAGAIGLLGALNGWRFLVSFRTMRIERELKRDPELWRQYKERRKHD